MAQFQKQTQIALVLLPHLINKMWKIIAISSKMNYGKEYFDGMGKNQFKKLIIWADVYPIYAHLNLQAFEHSIHRDVLPGYQAT